MSQAFLEMVIPAVADAVTALCHDPRDVACLERVSAGARPDMLVWHISDSWISPLEDLPLPPEQRKRLLQAADAIAEGLRPSPLPGRQHLVRAQRRPPLPRLPPH